MIRVEISNADLQRIAKRFDQVDQAIKDRVDNIINETALNVQADAASNCPVVTNRLRSSIHIETAKLRSHVYSDNRGNTFDGTLNLNLPRYAAAVGTNVEYGPSVEARRHMLVNAAKTNQPGFDSKIREAIKDVV